MPTFNSVQATLGGLTVTGVTRKYSYPPTQIHTADMPLMFPQLPSGDDAIASFTGVSGLGTQSMELIIIVGPYRQDQASANFNLAVDLMDNLQTALETEMAADKEIDGWEMAQRILTYDGQPSSTDYMAIVATVRFS